MANPALFNPDEADGPVSALAGEGQQFLQEARAVLQHRGVGAALKHHLAVGAAQPTPVVVDGHAYIHLQNQRFACIDLSNGTRTWTSKPFGKYSSMVAQNEHILALDQTGKLILLRANPREFEMLDERKISDQETWGHVAISGDEIFVRELNALSVYRWKKPAR